MNGVVIAPCAAESAGIRVGPTQRFALTEPVAAWGSQGQPAAARGILANSATGNAEQGVVRRSTVVGLRGTRRPGRTERRSRPGRRRLQATSGDSNARRVGRDSDSNSTGGSDPPGASGRCSRSAVRRVWAKPSCHRGARGAREDLLKQEATEGTERFVFLCSLRCLLFGRFRNLRELNRRLAHGWSGMELEPGSPESEEDPVVLVLEWTRHLQHSLSADDRIAARLP
ncbi:MAG: hypothetical protein KatS3mg082_2894 [Nitrospiraceae bacterium]|nr:MAG: hypothetical protein KatS3mg082_2894 [Nitrospiraceae bacterium]